MMWFWLILQKFKAVLRLKSIFTKINLPQYHWTAQGNNVHLIKYFKQATIPHSHGHGWCRSPGHWRRPCPKYQSKDAWEPLLPANQVLPYNRLHSLIDKRLACYLFEAMPRWQFEEAKNVFLGTICLCSWQITSDQASAPYNSLMCCCGWVYQ